MTALSLVSALREANQIESLVKSLADRTINRFSSNTSQAGRSALTLESSSSKIDSSNSLPGLKDHYCIRYSYNHRYNNLDDSINDCELVGGRLAMPKTDLQFDEIRTLCRIGGKNGCRVNFLFFPFFLFSKLYFIQHIKT